jgi:hypothetical protein
MGNDRFAENRCKDDALHRLKQWAGQDACVWD